MIPVKLSRLDAERLITHLTSLQGEDRRLRFGGVVTDEYIRSYVTKSFDTECKWFGISHIDGHIIAACHASIIDGSAELGCSVNKEYRNLKLAQAMFDRAVTWLRTKNISEVFMHCLSENGAMKHIARKNDMTVATELGDTDASVDLAPPTIFTPLVDAYVDRIALYDMMYKTNMGLMKQFYR